MAIVALDRELVVGPFEADDAEYALRYLARALVARGYVLDTFPDAVVEREKEFPTGLPASGVGVAIPHCDAQHVVTPTIAVGTLVRPVEFGVMGSLDETVQVEIIIMLALNNPDSQIEMLQKVSSMILDHNTLCALRTASTREEVISVLEAAMGA